MAYQIEWQIEWPNRMANGGAYDDKFYIKVFGIYPTINL